MKSAKYIIFDNNGLDLPVVFSPLVNHCDMAALISKPVISAGLCRVITIPDKVFDTKPAWECFGRSISLNKTARPIEDSEILNNYLEYEL